jgi:hypothetical protein
VCADCWGSKGGPQFWVGRRQGSPSAFEELLGVDPLSPYFIGGAVAAAPAVILVLVWILG